MNDDRPETVARPDEDLLGVLISSLWRYRWRVLVFCLLTSVAAVGVALARSTTTRVQIRFAIGVVPTGNPIEPARVVATRLSSRKHVGSLLAAEPEGPRSLPESLSLQAKVGPEGRIVSLWVEDDDPATAALVARLAARDLVESHEAALQLFIDARKQQISEYRTILGEIQDSRRAAVPTPEVSASGGTLSSEEDGAWAAAVGLIKYLTKLQDENLPPHAVASEIVLGPDVQRDRMRGRIALAGIAGGLAGLFLVVFGLLVRSIAAPYLVATGE